MAESELLGLAGLRSVAVQSTHIQRVQLLTSSPSSSKARTPEPSLRQRLQRQCRSNAWLLLTLGFICCWATTNAATSKSKTDNAVATSNDLYIVLVSIPVLDKVLPLKHLAETLLSRGVRVGFALPENCRQWMSDLEGLEFISLGNIVGKGRATALDPSELHNLGVYESYANTLRYYASFQRPMFGALLEDLEDDRPDLVVVDRYTFAGFDACHRLQLPYVVNDPHLLFDIDSPPAYIPAPFSNFTMHTTSVLERCLNSYYRLRFRLGLVHVYKEINAVRQEYGLKAIDSKHQMHGHSLVLVNSVFGLDEARPMAPQFKMVGLLQSQKLQREREEATGRSRFPAALTTWLEAPDHQDKPLIFISFQTDVPLTPEFITTTMNALETVNARLLWKITLQEQAAFDLRSRPRGSVMFLGDGLDDATVLALAPEIELLVTAGDFPSMQEALVVGVPILGLPHSAEQVEGVDAVVRAGAGLRLDGKSFSESSLRDAVDRMLVDEHEHFKANAEHLGELLKTGGGVERAVDELLAVAEFGARHLLPMRNLQPLYKTYLVDVYLIYGAILCGAAIILRTFVSVVLSIFQPLTPLEVLEAEELAANGQMSRADEVGHKAVQ
ncbi:hypothetical protein F441_00249 [Phytophthora nicotianae CJ01A1]|uniref:UDP-glycosyltransferases domain-containing protein n=4 Tax=Phytophthora nicotianae TaxID=4792 RepID=V9G127_PHYNI|nr:hypothetical protein F443_00260 [Phytophthora nicotianae P1569]ETM03588.1 hypothetical protein L917_00209 [Phytophthora nicotianae]ETM56866.1 hypothetical protein L914_00225 [Phytophthora nicotianae]ETO86183.1 hypothetical protein F444_00253 [Phytophthora nicotianae P1976]ETP27218.1 hypothetical protein F441_00249 [Phytophthora nicotianae CJ01A1]